MINFTKFKNITLIISFSLILLSLIFIIKNNFNLGLEFTGGMEIELESKNIINITLIKKKLIDIKDVKIKHYGSNKNIIIKIKKSINTSINEQIKSALNKELTAKDITIVRSNYIGAEVNKNTIYNSILAIITALISMSLYLTYRFEYKFAISATITLCHDMIILLGIISIFRIELNLTILAALFAIFGYSINDTVIIFDRIREYIKKYKDQNLKLIINMSINSTLSRTMITSISTLIVSIILIFAGGDSLFYFALILSLGIIIGTYSSIYVAAMLTLLIGTSKTIKRITGKLNNYFI